ncbi:hypothetical protein [Streptomyces sp. NPDC003393]
MAIDAGRPRNAPAAQMHGFPSRDGTTSGDLFQAGRRQAELGLSSADWQGAVTAHALVFGGRVPAEGRLSDMPGHERGSS